MEIGEVAEVSAIQICPRGNFLSSILIANIKIVLNFDWMTSNILQLRQLLQ
jgi:hypothetical protein